LHLNHLYKIFDKYKLLIYLFEENKLYYKTILIKDTNEYNALLMQGEYVINFIITLKIPQALYETCFMRFNFHVSVQPNNILIHVQQNATLHSLFHLETALHVSGGTTPMIRSTNNCIYSIWYLSHRFECAVSGVRHPQHTQTGSNSSTIAADSNNGVWGHPHSSYSLLRFTSQLSPFSDHPSIR
jgi:hypothetical protein